MPKKKIFYFFGILTLLVTGLTYYIEKNKNKGSEDYIGIIFTEHYTDIPKCVEKCYGNKKKLSCKDRLWDEGISSLWRVKYKECTFLCDGKVSSINPETGEACDDK